MNTIAAHSVSRGRFAGVLQIARYNWPQYACSVVVLVAATVWLARFAEHHTWLWFTIAIAAMLAAWWCVVSLVVSHWVYDRSALYRWSWIPGVLGTAPVRWLNLHAGLDESSTALHLLFPDSRGCTYDFYPATEISEPSIRRARAERRPQQSKHLDFSHFPFADKSFDAIFVLFAAHELRRRASREVFFGELRRVISPSGKIMLVEHTRDLANFVAFGPGFLHFLPGSEWRRLARVNSLDFVEKIRSTPFVNIMLLRRQL